MAIHELAHPLSIAADPAKTGGKKIGVLLSHGFTGQPASIKPWGEALGERGYAVEVPRLPGHGTSWQEMNTTRWEDWYGEIERTFEKLAAENDAVVVGGLSMGGALAMALAEKHNDRIAGLILVNPAIATKRFDVKLLPVLKHLVPSFPGITNDIKKPGGEEYGYPKTPLKAAHSMMRAWPKVAADLHRITVPTLYFRSAVDHVVDELTEGLVAKNIGSDDFTVQALPESYHVATLDNDFETIVSESADFVSRVTR